jgi:hypothetical protein
VIVRGVMMIGHPVIAANGLTVIVRGVMTIGQPVIAASGPTVIDRGVMTIGQPVIAASGPTVIDRGVMMIGLMAIERRAIVIGASSGRRTVTAPAASPVPTGIARGVMMIGRTRIVLVVTRPAPTVAREGQMVDRPRVIVPQTRTVAAKASVPIVTMTNRWKVARDAENLQQKAFRRARTLIGSVGIVRGKTARTSDRLVAKNVPIVRETREIANWIAPASRITLPPINPPNPVHGPAARTTDIRPRPGSAVI